MKPVGLQPHAWAITRALRGFAHRIAKWRWFHVSAYGRENIPAKGGAVVISNHISFGDPPILWATATRNMVIIAMKELWRTPMFLIMILLGHIPIDRGNSKSATKARQRMLRVVKARGLLGGYPEGKISKDGTQLPFKSGLFDVAREANVPVIPAGIAGSNELWPLGSKRIHRKRHAVMVYGTALNPADYATRGEFIRAGELAVAACVTEARARLAATA
jgi:1-acyl-sn-glycerol-3-phosphate acyltransferase